MKIYLFNPETGIYLGEDFADEMAMPRGRYVIPDDATAIAPPQVKTGEVLMFNAGMQRWEICEPAVHVEKALCDTLSGERTTGVSS